MALMRETVGSFRTYLYLAGALGALSNLGLLLAPQAHPIDRGVGLVGLGLCALLLYLAATLPAKLRTQLGFVRAVLWALIGFNCLMLGTSIVAALVTGGFPNVLPIIGILIGWYLLANARRLHDELAAQGE